MSYLFSRKLGTGSYGEVVSCVKISPFKEPGKPRKCAIKLINKCSTSNFNQCIIELDILSKISHPFIVSMIDFSYDINIRGLPSDISNKMAFYMVLEHGDSNCNRYITNNTSMLIRKRIIWMISCGLEYLHGKGIIHRDLKPDNILIFDYSSKSTNGTSSTPDISNASNYITGNSDIVAKICDFGLSKLNTQQDPNNTRAVTPWYRAPELCVGNTDYDYKSDIWSLGCIFYEIVKVRPYLTDSPVSSEEVLHNIAKNIDHKVTENEIEDLCGPECPDETKTRVMSILNTRNSKPTMESLLGIDKLSIDTFDTSDGTYEEFCSLLRSTLVISPSQRYSSTEVIYHRFFDSVRIESDEIRTAHSPVRDNEDVIITIFNCSERKIVAQLIHSILENRESFSWFNFRSIARSIDLYDRYIEHLYEVYHPETGEPILDEIDEVHNMDNIMKYVSCLYISLKGESILNYPDRISNILDPKDYNMNRDVFMGKMRDMEVFIVKHLCQGKIFRHTVYEEADNYNMELTEEQKLKLIEFYVDADTCKISVENMFLSFAEKFDIPIPTDNHELI